MKSGRMTTGARRLPTAMLSGDKAEQSANNLPAVSPFEGGKFLQLVFDEPIICRAALCIIRVSISGAFSVEF